MAVELLDLQNDGASLEFENEDLPAVQQAILARFGRLETERHLIYENWRFGGCEFTFQNDGDDPCVIGSSPAEVAMLRSLCADLNDGVVRMRKPFDPAAA